MDRRCRNLNCLIGGTHRQRHVNDQIRARIELVVSGLESLETGGLGDHGVKAGRDVRNDVIARFVRCGLAFDAALVLHVDLGVRNRCARRVLDET